jgi:hypothetical protein
LRRSLIISNLKNPRSFFLSFQRRAPGGSFFLRERDRLSTNSVVRRCRRRCSVQVSFRDFLQTITFGNTLLSNLFPPFRGCVHNETFGLALQIFWKKEKKMENFIFSSEFSYGLSLLRKQSKMNRSS